MLARNGRDHQVDKMVSLVDSMPALPKRSAVAKNPNDKVQLEREIESTDELYGLTEDEIKIVEESG